MKNQKMHTNSQKSPKNAYKCRFFVFFAYKCIHIFIHFLEHSCYFAIALKRRAGLPFKSDHGIVGTFSVNVKN